MIRPFGGVQSLSGVAQPVFGTTVSAAFVPPPDTFSNNLNPGSNQTQIKIPVASTVGFRVGDQVSIGGAASFAVGGATTLADVGTIKGVVDGTHLLVQGLTEPHGNGEFCVLNEEVGNVHIIPVSTTAVVYLGTAPTVAAGDPSVIDILPIVAAATAPTYAHDSESIGGSQPLNTAQYWMIGTAADKVCARFTQV